MKLNGLVGSGSGKLGNAVFSFNGGKTIVRQYQPNVTNPQTDAQIEQRAKLKLMSQLAASLAPAIAIKREGTTSGRNQFVSQNFPLVTYSGGAAMVQYENLQLTKSNVALPAVTAQRSDAIIAVKLAQQPSPSIVAVAYFEFAKNAEGTLDFVGSVISNNAGTSGLFEVTLPNANRDIVIYAYGMRAASERAINRYRNYVVTSGSDLAVLYVTSLSSYSDNSLTQTRGLTLAMGASEVEGGSDSGAVSIFASIADGQGTISINGGTAGTSVNAQVEAGSSVTIAVTPASGYRFRYLRDANGRQYTANPLTISDVTSQVDLTAIMAVVAEQASVPAIFRLGTQEIASDGSSITYNGTAVNATASGVEVPIEVGAGEIVITRGSSTTKPYAVIKVYQGSAQLQDEDPNISVRTYGVAFDEQGRAEFNYVFQDAWYTLDFMYSDTNPNA